MREFSNSLSVGIMGVSHTKLLKLIMDSGKEALFDPYFMFILT